MKKQEYKHVSYLWSEKESTSIYNNEVDLLIYRSNLLGADLRITNFGGGNTSCKIKAPDPLSGKETEVMWIKGSGGDLGTLKKNGLASIYLEKIESLKDIYKGIAYEDDMVELFNHCIYDLNSKAPSIDTPLHAFLPFKHIDHLHPDAVIAIAASKDGQSITREIFEDEIGWIEWQRPGFDLGIKLMKYVAEHTHLKGVILQSHGLFTWGETAFECYNNSLNIIEKAAAFIQKKQLSLTQPPFGNKVILSEDINTRSLKAISIAPLLRGFCSTENRVVGHFTDSEKVLEFINSSKLSQLAPMGTSCPDHFLRTKFAPLVLRIKTSENSALLENELQGLFTEYRNEYNNYYENNKTNTSPSIRNQNPVIILYPGVGMFSFAKDKSTARIAAEFYCNAINVMNGAETISTYTGLSKSEAFNIEYWLLEEAKLQRMPKPKPLQGKIALITGSGGGIGKAIAHKLATEGACVVLSDNNKERLEETKDEFIKYFGQDQIEAHYLDVTNNESINEVVKMIALNFGGIDILVNNAGISISKSIEEHSEQDWELLYSILVKGQMFMTQAVSQIMKCQKTGGDIINIVSKNGIVSGPNNAGYGSAKAAQLHLSRLHAAELGKDKIRVNIVNPDAVIAGSNIWNNGWAAGRAKAYGIAIEELPNYYASRTLLNEIILPADIANACFALVSGLLNKSTGNIINVDGGVAAAFTR